MSLVRNGVILEQCATGVKVTFPTGEKRMVYNHPLTGKVEDQDKIIAVAKMPVDYRFPISFNTISR
jgi:hypothetical protein